MRGKDRSPVQHAPDGIDEFLCGIRLAQIPVGAGRRHLTDQLVGSANRKDQDFCFRAMLGNFRDSGESDTEKRQFGVGTKPNEILGDAGLDADACALFKPFRIPPDAGSKSHLFEQWRIQPIRTKVQISLPASLARVKHSVSLCFSPGGRLRFAF